MVRRQRHLGGADEVQVVGLAGGTRSRRPGRGSRCPPWPRAHQRRRDHRGEARCAVAMVHRQVDQRQLQQRAHPGQVVEPRAGDLRAALDVDGAEGLADLEVVADGDALGREVADASPRSSRTRKSSSPPTRRVRVHEVGDGQRRARRRRCGGLARAAASAALTCVGQLLGPGQQRRAAPRRPALATCLPRSFCSARSASKRGAGGPAGLVGGEQRRRRARDPRRGGLWEVADRVGIGTQSAQVDHESTGYAAAATGTAPPWGPSGHLADLLLGSAAIACRRICSNWARAAICWANSAVWIPWNRPSSQPTSCAWAIRSSASLGTLSSAERQRQPVELLDRAPGPGRPPAP